MSVTASDSADLLGKAASDLQQDIVIGSGKITGKLKYVTGYTGFSGDPAEQSGNYLALLCESDEADAITVELVGGNVGHPVTLDSDGLIVIRITDKSSQSIRIVASKDGSKIAERTYALDGLTVATGT